MASLERIGTTGDCGEKIFFQHSDQQQTANRRRALQSTAPSVTHLQEHLTVHFASQPTTQPTIRGTCTYFEGLTQPSATCKLLKVQDSYRVKRLASRASPAAKSARKTMCEQYPPTLTYCLNAKSRRSARCYKKLNSAPKLIQRTPRRLLRDYVLHRTRCTQEDDQLLRQGRGGSCVSRRQDWIDPPGAG